MLFLLSFRTLCSSTGDESRFGGSDVIEWWTCSFLLTIFFRHCRSTVISYEFDWVGRKVIVGSCSSSHQWSYVYGMSTRLELINFVVNSPSSLDGLAVGLHVLSRRSHR